MWRNILVAAACASLSACGGRNLHASKPSVASIAASQAQQARQLALLQKEVDGSVGWVLWRRIWRPGYLRPDGTYSPGFSDGDDKFIAIAAGVSYYDCFVLAEDFFANHGWTSYVRSKNPWEVRRQGLSVDAVCLPRGQSPSI